MTRLADVVIAGEMKCGTTSLAHHLDEHPTIGLAATTPVRFFDDRWRLGINWYASQFAHVPPGALACDDTPNYLFDASAIERLGRTLPDAKVIVLLREPVDRAWSHYWHHDRTGFDRRGFETAIATEIERGVGTPGTAEGSGYLARGYYERTLAHLRSEIDPSRIHVEFFDRLAADPVATVQRVYRFLGVDDAFVPPGIDTVYNVGWAPTRPRIADLALRLRLPRRLPFGLGRRLVEASTRRLGDHEIDPALRARLEEHFAPHLLALGQILDDVEDLPAWVRRA